MSISFTPQQRKDITRRQLNIGAENAAYTKTVGSLSDVKTKLLSVDDANKVFYDFQSVRVKAYELESQQMNGSIAAEFTDGQIDPYIAGDLSTSAKTPGAAGALFFPSTPPYGGFIPKVVGAVNGINNPTGTDTRYEQNILTNASVYDGLTEMIFRLNNGITGASSGNTTSTTAIPAGVQASIVLTVSSTTNFAVNDLVYINNGAASGLYQITAITPTTSMTVKSIIHSLTGIGSGSTVDNTVVAFTPTERQTLVSSLYQELLTNLTNRIIALVLEWELKIDTQITQLGANNEDRSPYTTQNTAALADVNNTKSIIDAWQALSNTGVSGKFVSGSIGLLSSEITARQTFITGRLAQIITALGSVSATSETAYTGVVGSPYYERYKWLNIRINSASGSARRFFDADRGIGFLGMLAADNTALQGEYDTYFVTKAIAFIDETTIIQVKDVINLAVGQSITVLSETQPELQRAIMEVMGTTQLRLDKPIPNSYLVVDQARIFRTL